MTLDKKKDTWFKFSQETWATFIKINSLEKAKWNVTRYLYILRDVLKIHVTNHSKKISIGSKCRYSNNSHFILFLILEIHSVQQSTGAWYTSRNTVLTDETTWYLFIREYYPALSPYQFLMYLSLDCDASTDETKVTFLIICRYFFFHSNYENAITATEKLVYLSLLWFLEWRVFTDWYSVYTASRDRGHPLPHPHSPYARAPAWLPCIA